MGERAKVILNEYSAKNLLMRDTLDLDKFYTADLKLFVEVARKEIERLNNIINKLEKYCIEEIEDYSKEIKSQYITDNTRRQYEGEKVCFEDILGRLQELKGNGSNE